MIYHPEMTLRDARTRYFVLNDFKDGGYDETWVKMKAGPIPIWFPNTKARVRAVRFHDLHHVLTEYATTWSGEAEIGAWEVSTGCREHYAAWILNLEAMAIGLAINTRGVFRAFVRGRHSYNLYGYTFDDALLSEKVGEMRGRLRLSASISPATIRDKLSFAGWSLVSVLTLAIATLATLLPLVLLIAVFVWLRAG